MLDTLLAIDQSLLLFFNGWHTPYWDMVMWIYTGKIIWIPLILSILYTLLRAGGWRETLWAVAVVAVVVVLCDQFSSSVCKPFFERLRPAREPEIAQMVTIVNGYRGGLYGFFSSHAANAAGIVTFTALLFHDKIYTATAILWATITCYSRMYLGVHYPGDILVGIIWGTLVGAAGYWCYTRGRKWVSTGIDCPYIHTRYAHIITSVVYITFATILTFAPIIGFSIR